MSKFVETQYVSNKEILKIQKFDAIPVTVDDTGITPDLNGKKIVKAGTIIGGVSGSRLEDPDQLVMKQNNSNAEGVLLYDVDVTYGSEAGSMVIHGYIDLNKIPESPTQDAKEVLNMIKFLG